MALLLGLFGGAAVATPPLREMLTINGETAELYGDKLGAFSGFPWSPVLHKIARNAHLCSAMGAPTGHYELRDGQLWLIAFGRCGPVLSLDAAYGKPTSPIPAEWLSGHFWAGQGKLLCLSPYGEHVWQTRLELQVERGKVLRQSTQDQAGNPRVPADGELTNFCLDR